MTERDRLLELIASKPWTIPKFAQKIGVSKDTIYNIKKGKTPISDDFRSSLYENVTNLSRIWFETGEGPMFIEGQPDMLNEDIAHYSKDCQAAIRDRDYIIKTYEKIIEEQRKVIDDLKQLNIVKKP